jgi:hypothetical protein
VSEPPQRTEAQQEWADWAEHGYEKIRQPRSVRRFGLIFTTAFALGLIVLVYLVTH